MSSKKTSIDGLSAAVLESLTSYSKDVQDGIDTAAKKAARNAVQRLKAGGPYKGGEQSGYNAGWRSKVTEGPAGIEVVVHNAKAPGLTHLLEKGHAKPGGGRTRAFPHIAPAEEEAVNNFKQDVERVIKNG